MPLPSPLVAFLESGIQVTIKDAYTETRKDIVVYEKSVYRDINAQTGSGAGVQVNDASLNVNGGTTPVVTTPGGFTGSTIVSPSSTVQDDPFTHKPQRQVPKMDTLVEFWGDGDVGIEMQITADLTNGSGIITVPDARLLTPGQTISALPDIPADTIILSILSYDNTTGLVDTTKAVMSKVATTDNVVTATLSGGAPKVGSYRESEFVTWGSELKIPT